MRVLDTPQNSHYPDECYVMTWGIDLHATYVNKKGCRGQAPHMTRHSG